jgi:signal transduction histidine kinase
MAAAEAEVLMAAGPGTHKAVPAQGVRVAEEQAALRRIAVQVARAAPPEEVFAAVTGEVHRELGSDCTVMCRFNPGKTLTVVGVQVSAGIAFPITVGLQGPIGGRNAVTLVFRTGRPARIDDQGDDVAATGLPRDFPDATLAAKATAAVRAAGMRSSAGVPISVEGRLWGAMVVFAAHERRLPPDTAERLAGFTELVATAIAGAEARQALRQVADEQAALRRVATLVARGSPPAAVFAAVAEEVAALFSADTALVMRLEPDDRVTLMGDHGWVTAAARVPGAPLPAGTLPAIVRETGRAARFDADDPVSGPANAEWGYRSAVNVPIVAGGRLWGVIGAGLRHERLPPDTEERLAGFTELVATAIANAEAQAELMASRARLVAAADQARRRFERDLHDGAQQQLVSLALQLRAARADPPRGDDLAQRLDEMAATATGALEEVREIARGLHPAVLAAGGLRPALSALARRSAVPVQLHVQVAGRLPDPVEVAAYYAVAETLTNTAKHSCAAAADVRVSAADGVLRVRVHDDGRGGADFAGSSGLVGLKDRVEALGGRISLHSRPGNGTTVEITLPLEALAPLVLAPGSRQVPAGPPRSRKSDGVHPYAWRKMRLKCAGLERAHRPAISAMVSWAHAGSARSRRHASRRRCRIQSDTGTPSAANSFWT